jgi:hypothetical protein
MLGGKAKDLLGALAILGGVLVHDGSREKESGDVGHEQKDGHPG